MRRRRGQISLEYLTLLAVGLAALAPLALWANDQLARGSATPPAEVAARRIAGAADRVVTQGVGSAVTVDFVLPPGIDPNASRTFASGNLVQFTLVYGSERTEVFALTRAVVNGTLPSSPGLHFVKLRVVAEGNVTLELIGDDAPPFVTLNTPADGGVLPYGNARFYYTPADDRGLSSATLYGNFSGAWASNATNAGPVSNNNLNFIATYLPKGYYRWNVLVCDTNATAQCAFATANRTVRVEDRLGTLLYQFNGTWAGDRFGWAVGTGEVDRDGRADVLGGAVWGDTDLAPDAGYLRVNSGANGTQLYEFWGIANNDTLGASVGAADTNYDGKADPVAGVPLGNAAGLTNNGYVRLYAGDTGALVYQHNGSAANDQFGYSVAVADVNGDGRADVAGGAPFGDVGVSNGGYVRVFSSANNQQLFQFAGSTAGDQLGYSLAAGDVNGDGLADLIAGANLGNAGGLTDNGYVRVYNGAGGALLYQFNGSTAGDQFGSAVAAADVNGDGRQDVLAGAWLGNAGGLTDNGYVRVYNGVTGDLLHQFNGSAAGDRLGASVAGGDANGDQRAEVFAGAVLGDAAGLTDNGYARAYNGSNGALVLQVNGSAAGDGLGSGIAAGDVNGDGLADLVVGAYLGDAGTTDNGYARVYAGGA